MTHGGGREEAAVHVLDAIVFVRMCTVRGYHGSTVFDIRSRIESTIRICIDSISCRVIIKKCFFYNKILS